MTANISVYDIIIQCHVHAELCTLFYLQPNSTWTKWMVQAKITTTL